MGGWEGGERGGERKGRRGKVCLLTKTTSFWGIQSLEFGQRSIFSFLFRLFAFNLPCFSNMFLPVHAFSHFPNIFFCFSLLFLSLVISFDGRGKEELPVIFIYFLSRCISLLYLILINKKNEPLQKRCGRWDCSGSATPQWVIAGYIWIVLRRT